MKPINDLLKFNKVTASLNQILGILQWDQETFMPDGSGTQRADQLKALTAIVHERMVSEELGDLLNGASQFAESHDLNQNYIAMLNNLAKDRRRAVAVPVELAAEIARVTSLAIKTWREARSNEDIQTFLPCLAEVVALKREEAAAVSGDVSGYQSLLSEYEPDMTTDMLDQLFGALRNALTPLLDKVMRMQTPPPQFSCLFPRKQQLRLARELAGKFGYDWNVGRLDVSTHPFTSGEGLDVRITTRVDTGDPFNCIYSTIHEAGHGTYEQNIDSSFALTPIGSAASYGVHESQSRFFENQIGRSRAFSSWLFERIRSEFGEIGIDEADGFYRRVNFVKRGYIRTEADEIQYNLHIMLRYDLERDLISGALEAEHMEEAWNTRFKADFGFSVDKPSNGLLQDIHWAAGLFGYFPTYTLGNIYAAILNEKLLLDVPGLEQSLYSGDPMPAVQWMRENVQRHGSVRKSAAAIRHAVGQDLSAKPLISYLQDKFISMHGYSVS